MLALSEPNVAGCRQAKRCGASVRPSGVHPMRVTALLLFVFSVAAQEPILRVPPARIQVEVEHQPVAITASGTVSSSDRQDRYSLSLSADLSDLQAHATDILKAALDRSDDCGERIAILGARLVPEQPHAILTADMHFERWACGKALGKTIKKRVVAGNGTVRLALTPALASPTQTGLDTEVREITADGTLGELLRSGSLGSALREKIRASVQSALDKSDRRSHHSAHGPAGSGAPARRLVWRCRRWAPGLPNQRGCGDSRGTTRTAPGGIGTAALVR